MIKTNPSYTKEIHMNFTSEVIRKFYLAFEGKALKEFESSGMQLNIGKRYIALNIPVKNGKTFNVVYTYFYKHYMKIWFHLNKGELLINPDVAAYIKIPEDADWKCSDYYALITEADVTNVPIEPLIDFVRQAIEKKEMNYSNSKMENTETKHDSREKIETLPQRLKDFYLKFESTVLSSFKSHDIHVKEKQEYIALTTHFNVVYTFFYKDRFAITFNIKKGELDCHPELYPFMDTPNSSDRGNGAYRVTVTSQNVDKVPMDCLVDYVKQTIENNKIDYGLI